MWIWELKSPTREAWPRLLGKLGYHHSMAERPSRAEEDGGVLVGGVSGPGVEGLFPNDAFPRFGGGPKRLSMNPPTSSLRKKRAFNRALEGSNQSPNPFGTNASETLAARFPAPCALMMEAVFRWPWTIPDPLDHLT